MFVVHQNLLVLFKKDIHHLLQFVLFAFHVVYLEINCTFLLLQFVVRRFLLDCTIVVCAALDIL